MSDLPSLHAAREARARARDMSDLRHTWEAGVRYTCPECGEVLLRRDPNDLCPAKVVARLVEAEAALAPFAAFADTFTSMAPDSQIVAEWGTPRTPVLITVGSLRAAARAAMKAADSAAAPKEDPHA